MNDKANILIIGNSGVGKSTLVNTVFNFADGEGAKVGNGGGVTQRMQVYENSNVNFRIIDTKGLEYGLMSQIQTKHAIEQWSKAGVKKRDEKKYIHIIWYCIDGTSKKIFNQSLKILKDVAHLWKGIPVVIVITKSYSEIEEDENKKMIKESLDKYKGTKGLEILDIIPVIAQQYSITNDIVVPTKGIDQLIERTNEIIPEALKLNQKAVFNLNLKIKRTNANALVIAAVSGATVVGAIPIPVADTAILTPLQASTVMGIINIYGGNRDKEMLKEIGRAIIGCGAIGVGAKGIVSALKAIPGINIAASIINAFVAAIITLVIGEITIIIMEKICKGEIEPEDLDIIRKMVESEFADSIGKYRGGLDELMKGKNVHKVVTEAIGIFKNRKN